MFSWPYIFLYFTYKFTSQKVQYVNNISKVFVLKNVCSLFSIYIENKFGPILTTIQMLWQLSGCYDFEYYSLITLGCGFEFG